MMSQMLERQHVVEVRIKRSAHSPLLFFRDAHSGREPRFCVDFTSPLLLANSDLPPTEPILREPPRAARATHHYRRTADSVH